MGMTPSALLEMPLQFEGGRAIKGFGRLNLNALIVGPPKAVRPPSSGAAAITGDSGACWPIWGF